MNQNTVRLGFLACLFISITFSSCDVDCIRGEGSPVAEDRQTTSFHSIRLKVPAKLVLTQGSELQTRIEAQKNLLSHIKTDSRGEKLEISSDECIGENSGITIYITIPEIELLSVEGSGSIESKSAINATKLELALSGSGDITLDATAEVLYCGIKGSGNVILKGSSKQQYIKIDGSGNFKSAEFPTENTEVYINGSGDADIFAITKLKAEINGSGNIHYKGNPDVKSRINGSGNISRLP